MHGFYFDALRAWTAVLVVGWAAAPPVAAESVSIKQTAIKVRHVDYQFALERGDNGVPKLNWMKFRARRPQIVETKKQTVVLENQFVRATFLMEHGLLYSFVYRPSGNEQLWKNPAAKPISAHNDTGFWVAWGGSENVLPRGEHGTSHAIPWRFRTVPTRGDRKTVEMRYVEPLTGLEHTLRYTLGAGQDHLETEVLIRNPGSKPVRFSHWTNNMFAPGGLGEITAKTEFIVPAAEFVPADKPFNAWMKPLLGPPADSVLRFAGSWRNIGDLMTTGLTEPFFAAYSPEAGEAIVRTVDLKYIIGFNIWTWGFPPPISRQREFTANPPNNGYVEMWTGTVKDYSNESLRTIQPGVSVSWKERMCVVTAADSSRVRVLARQACSDRR